MNVSGKTIKKSKEMLTVKVRIEIPPKERRRLIGKKLHRVWGWQLWFVSSARWCLFGNLLYKQFLESHDLVFHFLCYVTIRMLNILKGIENNFLKLKSDYTNRAYSIPGKTILKHRHPDTHEGSLLEIFLDRKIKSHSWGGKSQISLIFLHSNP